MGSSYCINCMQMTNAECQRNFFSLFFALMFYVYTRYRMHFEQKWRAVRVQFEEFVCTL